MTRQTLAAYLMDTYSTEGEPLFAEYPGFLVDMSYDLTNK